MKRLVLGTIVSTIFIYFSFQGVELDKALRGIKDTNYIFLIPAIALFLIPPLLKSLRWGIILSPIESVSLKRLIPIICVGQMAVVMIPMRLGELMRPYLLSSEREISLSSSIATIFVERIFDLLTVLSISFLVVFCTGDSVWFARAGYSLLVIIVVLILFVLLSHFRTETMLKLFNPLLNKLPGRFHVKIESLVHAFVTGFKIISSPKKLIYTLILSFLIWGCFGLGIFMLLRFCNFQLSPIVAFVILISTVIGVSLPTAPGMVGNFHYATIVALALFGISKSEALSFSILYHLTAIGKHILLGLIFLPSVQISFKDMLKRYGLEKKRA
ncbi:MAG: flippase-like domain-containing protein [Candidatus Scalindua sp.]|jgi:glycosyltransferase 2 family protein|nr:flippase-like domain-containing protein [Candidatus Scalindua sp.]